MGFLDALFSGARAFINDVIVPVLRTVQEVAVETVRLVLQEVDRSEVGRATSKFVAGATQRFFGDAADLAAREREIAERYRRDGRRSSADEDRLKEIELERERLRKELDAAKAAEAAAALREAEGDLVRTAMTDDETSAVVGILSSRLCPTCGGSMRICQAGYNAKTRRSGFYWQCSSHPFSCRNIAFDPLKEKATVLRQADLNLDLDIDERRAIWTRSDVLKETQSRLRKHLGDTDEEVICPHHLLPMKLLELPSADGRLLTTYQYVCMHVDDEARACQHKVPLESFPQVSETLRRNEGQGIIR